MNTPAVESASEFGQSALLPIVGIAGRTLEGVERLTQLNMQTVKTSLAEQKEIAAEAISTRSLEWVMALPCAQSQAAVKKALAYWRHASNIAIETVADNVGYGWCSLNDYSRWAATLLGDAAAPGISAVSTELVVADPEARLPAVAEPAVSDLAATPGKAGKSRGASIVDTEGNTLSTKKARPN